MTIVAEARSDAAQFDRTRMFVAAIGFFVLAAASYAAAWTPLTELQIAVVQVTGALSIIGLAASAIAFAPAAAIQAAAAKIAIFGVLLGAGVAAYATFPVAPITSGTSGARVQFYVEGEMVTRTGCEGAFYAAAAKPGSSATTLMQIWLSDGTLNAAAGIGRPAVYKGTLRRDGSFNLVAVDTSPGGAKESLVGRIGYDGAMTATWNRVLGSGCVQYFKSSKGRLMGGARLADLLLTDK